MQDSELLASLAILVTLGAFLWGDRSMVGILPPWVAIVCFVFAFGIAIWLVVKNAIKGISGLIKRSKTTDTQTTKNKQIAINIGINSGDFIDNKMNTKRMNDFHKMVKDISSDGGDGDKQKSKIKK